LNGPRSLLAHPWAAFGVRLFRRYQGTRLPVLAAALAFYAAFSLGPLLLLFGGWLGGFLRTRPELAQQYREALINLVTQILPFTGEGVDLVPSSLEVIVQQLNQGALLRSLVSLGILLWASTGFFASLQLALEVIFEVSESRGFIRKRLVAVLLVLVVALVIGAELVGGALVAPLDRLAATLAEQLEALNIVLPPLPLPLGVAWAALFRAALAVTAFTLCFRFLPRSGADWTGALVGGLFSTTAIVVLRQALLLTLNVDRFNLIYGVITSLVILLLWLYLVLLLFLVGALLAAELSHTRRQRPAVP
jgi:membrane protein